MNIDRKLTEMMIYSGVSYFFWECAVPKLITMKPKPYYQSRVCLWAFSQLNFLPHRLAGGLTYRRFIVTRQKQYSWVGCTTNSVLAWPLIWAILTSNYYTEKEWGHFHTLINVKPFKTDLHQLICGESACPRNGPLLSTILVPLCKEVAPLSRSGTVSQKVPWWSHFGSTFFSVYIVACLASRDSRRLTLYFRT